MEYFFRAFYLYFNDYIIVVGAISNTILNIINVFGERHQSWIVWIVYDYATGWQNTDVSVISFLAHKSTLFKKG